MADTTLEQLYHDKDPSYFSNERNNLAELVPMNTQRVLDVGCGSGALGRLLKQKRSVQWVSGIEIDQKAAAQAEKNLDQVFQVNVENWEPEIEKSSLNAIVMADVVEHLVDPWAVVKKLSLLLKPSGVIVTSIPNVQCWRVLVPLLFRGRWDYADWGLLDKGHLRFFTRKSATQLLEAAGFEIKRLERDLPLSSISGKINALTFGLFKDFMTSHFIIYAEKKI